MTYTSEIFPTVLRSQGQGICMIVGSIGNPITFYKVDVIWIPQPFSILFVTFLGSTFAPLIKLTDFNPLMLLAIIGFFGFLLTLVLDENDGMRDFIERDQLRTPLIVTNSNNTTNKTEV